MRFQVTKAKAGDHDSLTIVCEGKRELTVKMFVWSVSLIFAGLRRTYWRIKPTIVKGVDFDADENVVIGRARFITTNNLGRWINSKEFHEQNIGIGEENEAGNEAH